MKTGVLLVNIGTPDSPEKKDVARYLQEFLMDPYVIDRPAFFRWILVNLIIVPLRSGKSAHAYKSIWSQNGSPLMVHSRNLAQELQQFMGEKYHVELAMRYGKPHIARAFRRFAEAGVEKVLVIPQYPQFAESSSLSALERVDEIRRFAKFAKPVTVLREFYQLPEFIKTYASLISEYTSNRSFDHVLFSFHGIPERHLRKVAPESANCSPESMCKNLCNQLCYRGQCFATARNLALHMDVKPENYTVSFQSRVGGDRWIGPYTDKIIKTLVDYGKKNIAVVCPSFTADCLETIEEIGQKLRETFQNAGGENLILVPSLNASHRWVESLAKLVQRMESRQENLNGLLIDL